MAQLTLTNNTIRNTGNPSWVTSPSRHYYILLEYKVLPSFKMKAVELQRTKTFQSNPSLYPTHSILTYCCFT
jgi:hypothetical protein